MCIAELGAGLSFMSKFNCIILRRARQGARLTGILLHLWIFNDIYENLSSLLCKPIVDITNTFARIVKVTGIYIYISIYIYMIYTYIYIYIYIYIYQEIM